MTKRKLGTLNLFDKGVKKLQLLLKVLGVFLVDIGDQLTGEAKFYIVHFLRKPQRCPCVGEWPCHRKTSYLLSTNVGLLSLLSTYVLYAIYDLCYLYSVFQQIIYDLLLAITVWLILVAGSPLSSSSALLIKNLVTCFFCDSSYDLA